MFSKTNLTGFSTVTTSVNEPVLMKLIVEELAAKRNNMSMAGQKIDHNLVAVDTSSPESFVTGSIDVEYNSLQLSIPYVTGFIFTCLKSKRPFFEMQWAMSLS